MRIYEGVVREVGWQSGSARSAWIECPRAAVPAAGRYLMAWSPEQPEAPLATSLFAARVEPQGFLAAPPVPAAWEPGTALQLRGPLGRGFSPPGSLRRLALAGLGEGIARLQPLLTDALEKGAAVALFAGQAPPGLPSAVEVNPLETLNEALAWADYLALDLLAPTLPDLSRLLGVERGVRALPCPAQALLQMALPCGGLADCAACAVETRRGWKLACQDGPVFDLLDLLPRM
jgi:NAD(P)H-flavin reductase